MKGSNLRIGLVLGAGGPVGHAFHAGVLHALSEALAWDPRNAEIILGTSAGAQVGALLRAGMSATDLSARVMGNPLSRSGAEIAHHYTRPSYAHSPRARRYWPASPQYLGRVLMRPWQARLGRLISALLPEGRISLESQIEGFRRIFGDQWPKQSLWIPAVRLGCGQRVTFGRPEAPGCDVGAAVASSGAVPGVVEPIRIGRDRYVDGGMASLTNVDLLQESALDLVVVSSPLSRFAPMRYLLRRELRSLRRSGTDVLVLEPTAEGARAMGWNMMDPTRAGRVAAANLDMTLEQLNRDESSATRMLRSQKGG